ncbi:MAG: glycosyltransferase family 39 protein [Solirubrobacterales bacterium]
MSIPRKRPSTAALTLAGILLTGLVLRLWGIQHGLPFVYNLDEYAHFTESAVKMFGGGFNPNYFQNPPAFTYLLHVLFAFVYGGIVPSGAGSAVKAMFNGDPTELYTIARVTSALMGLGAAWVLYFAGRRLYNAAIGLAATAFLTFTFLTVHYSHFALNDVPTLLPLCVGFFGLAGIIQKGRAIDYLIAGLGLGLATATKYTAAALAVSIFVAWAIRAFDDRAAAKQQFTYLVGAGAVAAISFVVANPFAVLDADAFISGIRRQERLTSGVVKLGTDDTSGWQYYLWTLTWGWGFVPLALSVFGAGLALKRDWRKALPWVVFALLVWLFMGSQGRFYARWLMPIYPVLAVFAGYAVVELAMFASQRWRVAAGVAIATVALALPLAHVINNNTVMTRDDTRDQAKAWLLANVGEGERIAIELIGPRPYFNVGGTRGGDKQFDYYPLPRGTEVEKYATRLNPELLDTYAAGGYCHVVIGSIQKGRVTKAPELAPPAASAYYKALDQRGEKVASFSPMKDGADLPRFNFDISYNWYPLGYERPGPAIDVYRLSGGKCKKSESHSAST